MTDRIFSRQFHGAEGAEAWRVLPDGAFAFFRTDSFGTAARFVEAISGLPREGGEPSIDNFWTLADPAGNEVDVATTSAPDPAEEER